MREIPSRGRETDPSRNVWDSTPNALWLVYTAEKTVLSRLDPVPMSFVLSASAVWTQLQRRRDIFVGGVNKPLDLTVLLLSVLGDMSYFDTRWKQVIVKFDKCLANAKRPCDWCVLCLLLKSSLCSVCTLFQTWRHSAVVIKVVTVCAQCSECQCEEILESAGKRRE